MTDGLADMATDGGLGPRVFSAFFSVETDGSMGRRARVLKEDIPVYPLYVSEGPDNGERPCSGEAEKTLWPC